MLTPNGGVFGRNPKFNNVTVENNLTVNGDFTLGDDIVINDTLLVNGVATFRGGIICIPNSAAPTTNTVLGSGAGVAMQSGAISNTLVGQNAGAAITTGDENIAVGPNALATVTTNEGNVAVGGGALQFATGLYNVGVGHRAGNAVTSGDNNTAVGALSLNVGAGGSNNVAVGRSALLLNTASDITAVGANALDANTTGANNTAVGKDALGACTTGTNATAVGLGALASATGANWTTALGSHALSAYTSGNANTALGESAFRELTGGNNNLAVGESAGRFAGAGSTPATSLNDSIFVGRLSRANTATDSNTIVIGHNVVGNGSNTTTIGNSSTTGTFIPAGNLTLTNGNFIVGTSGKGIDFSATSDGTGTMTSELLSDYEEGTFTPTVSSGVTTPTYTTQAGRYTKIGRMVYFTIRIQLSGGTTNASALKLAGLPFTSSSDSAHRPGGAYLVYNDDFLTTNTDQLPQFLVPLTSTTVEVWQNDGNAFAGTSWNNPTGVFVWNGSYFT